MKGGSKPRQGKIETSLRKHGLEQEKPKEFLGNNQSKRDFPPRGKSSGEKK
jgi:hypothetical protein